MAYKNQKKQKKHVRKLRNARVKIKRDKSALEKAFDALSAKRP